MENLDFYFGNPVALIALIPFVVEFIKRKVVNASGSFIQYVSWFVGVVLAIIGWALNLGMFEPLTWWESLIIGVGCSLAANGVFDTGVVTWVLQKVGIIKT